MEEILSQAEEVDIACAARWLGVTPKMVSSYLKSRQLDGVKVGDEWFIKVQSLTTIRPLGTLLQDVVLPVLENPLSQHQYQQGQRKKGSNKKWDFKKDKKRNPMRLNCYGKIKEALALLLNLRSEINVEDFQFFQTEMLSLGDDVGAGYYSYGILKRKLYARARLRAGRLVSRALLLDLPQGFFESLCQVIEAITFLCRKLENLRVERSQPTKGV